MVKWKGWVSCGQGEHGFNDSLSESWCQEPCRDQDVPSGKRPGSQFSGLGSQDWTSSTSS